MSIHRKLLAFIVLAFSSVFGLVLMASAQTLTVVNNCSYTVYPGIYPPVYQNGGWQMNPGSSVSFGVSQTFNGRVWGRTGCNGASPAQCTTGSCGGSGLQCAGTTGQAGTSLAEFNLDASGTDYYDVSYVDGFDNPVGITSTNGSCNSPNTCSSAPLTQCSSDLRSGGYCLSPCTVYNTDQYCCRNAYGTSATCQPSTWPANEQSYVNNIHTYCPGQYSYAYDDSIGLHTCPAGGNYTITFCPAGGGSSGGGSGGSSPVAAGGQYNLLNPESGANLDVAGCGPGNGTNVQIWKAADGTCNNGAGQVWQANLNSDGTYTFINPESSGALDVASCGPANGTNIDLWNPANGTCNGGGGQKWSIQTNSNGTYTLINPESSGALDIAGCGTADGTNVDLWNPANGTCNGGAGQQWQFVPARSEGPSLNGAHVVHVSYNTGFVIDDWASSTAAGNIVDLYTANGTGAQSWNFANTGVVPAGDYNLAVLGANCMEVTGSGTANGTKVDIAPCNGQPNQSWNAVPLGTGYTLQPANANGMCLDSPSWTTTAGTQLQIWQCTGGTNQTWIVN